MMQAFHQSAVILVALATAQAGAAEPRTVLEVARSFKDGGGYGPSNQTARKAALPSPEQQ